MSASTTAGGGDTPRPAAGVPDWGATSADYARHRQGFPDAFYDRLEAAGLLRPGIAALDLGTGTGTVARALARRGAGRVLGLDPAPAQIEAARRLLAEEGAAEEGLAAAVEFRLGRAEETGAPDAAFDLVVAGQCWHWFDRPRAAAEARRVLRPGRGVLLICHYDWIPLPGSVAHATEYLIEAHSPRWRGGRGTGFHPAWAADLALGGFTGIAFLGFDHAAAYTHADWRGRVRASAGIGGTLDAAGVAGFDAAHARLLADRFPQEPLTVPHRVFAIWGFAGAAG